MKHKTIIIIITLGIFSLKNYCQSYYAIGYNIGKYTNGLPNMRNTIYHLNTIDYPNFDNKFNYTNLPHGVGVEWGFKTKKFYYFANWSNFHIKSKGNGQNPVNTSENIDLKLLVRYNKLSIFNVGINVTDKLGFAVSIIDLTTFKVLYKSNVQFNKTMKYNSKKWNDFYDVNKGMLSSYFSAASAFNIDYNLNKNINLRFTYSVDWFGADLGFTPSYRYRANYYNLNISYRLNKK